MSDDVVITSRDFWVLVQTVWGEARGEDSLGQVAVMHVIKNRAAQRQQPFRTICQTPFQFSCWNEHDPNLPKMQALHYGLSQIRHLAAKLLIAFDDPDITRGATHYHAKQVLPYWAKDKIPCLVIGNHLFYNDID